MARLRVRLEPPARDRLVPVPLRAGVLREDVLRGEVLREDVLRDVERARLLVPDRDRLLTLERDPLARDRLLEVERREREREVLAR